MRKAKKSKRNEQANGHEPSTSSINEVNIIDVNGFDIYCSELK